MCGRYYVDEETANEIEKIVRQADVNLSGARDIFPSQSAAVITGKNSCLTVNRMIWGFPKYDKKGLLINARAETVREKRTFRDSVLHRRCVIPAKHYYEWDASKTKVTFSRPQSPILYMAGFYQLYQEEERFVIITTQANDSVKKIHDRMPLILGEKELESWIYEDGMLDHLLHKTPPMLEHFQEFEQQTFSFLQ